MTSQDFNHKDLEKYSSAYTLSDMEIFIFPELFYSLVLANIMSPEIWKWRDDPWFANIENKSFTYKINRVKQYIMEHFSFNLDLDTWGLTDKEREMSRFSDFIDAGSLSRSNALFGYEGDKYYFDIDIRRHFGLDRYTSNIIPYWKTETVEAMMAFRHKEGFTVGAGECVSLSSLYAAAMFIVGRIPLEKIFLIATPLHSQNFIAERDGILTNNRRIVTKSMWYNGTELSAKARRAIENERITIVSHLTGYIHTMYDRATIDPEAYRSFGNSLRSFLTTDFNFELFTSFLRTRNEFWECFQYRHIRNNKTCYIDLHTVFSYEHSSRNKFTGDSRKALFEEIDARDFYFTPREGKIIINDFEEFLNKNRELSFDAKKDYFIDHILPERCNRMRDMFEEMRAFIHIEPRLPDEQKEYVAMPRLQITTGHTREEIMTHIGVMASQNEFAELARYAYREMEGISWIPFTKAAVERNPVCIEELKGKTIDEAYRVLMDMPGESIYSDNRLAQPDEMWNFGLGDGMEKAFVLINCMRHLSHDHPVGFEAKGSEVVVTQHDGKEYRFPTLKRYEKKLTVTGDIIEETPNAQVIRK
jgi:hypothetical protein